MGPGRHAGPGAGPHPGRMADRQPVMALGLPDQPSRGDPVLPGHLPLYTRGWQPQAGAFRLVRLFDAGNGHRHSSTDTGTWRTTGLVGLRPTRSAERRGGKEWVRTFIFWVS